MNVNVKGMYLFYFLAIGIVLIVLSYFFVDRQLVWFLVDHHSRQFSFLKIFANKINTFLTSLIFLYYIYYVIKRLSRSLNETDNRLLLVCNAVVIGQFMKDFMKFVFARYWTSTFVCNNPSLVHDHVYGFNWFKSGSTYQSFPSGHTAFIVSFSVSMWFLFPRLRWLWVLLSILVMTGQIGMYYHFVSDVIAGALLGTVVGIYTATHNDRTPVK